jgi:hypothetical protein
VTASVSVIVKQVRTGTRITPHAQIIPRGTTQQYVGISLDQFNHPMRTTPVVTYAIQSGRGTIDSTGLFTASTKPGHVVFAITVDGVLGTLGATIV